MEVVLLERIARVVNLHEGEARRTHASFSDNTSGTNHINDLWSLSRCGCKAPCACMIAKFDRDEGVDLKRYPGFPLTPFGLLILLPSGRPFLLHYMGETWGYIWVSPHAQIAAAK